MVYCVGWIKIKLGMQVGLGLATLCYMGTELSLPQRGTAAPIFGPYLLCPDGWMDLDGTWYGGMPRPIKATALDGDPAPLPKKRTEPPHFRPMSIVAKRLDG